MKHGPFLIALMMIFVIVAIGAWPALRIAMALERGESDARTSFFDLRRSALNTVSGPTAVSGESWRGLASEAWRTQSRLLACVVKSSDGQILYAIPGSSPYYRQTPTGLAFEAPSNTTTRYSGPLAAGMIMEALYVTLSQEALFFPVRDAALAFAVLLAIVVAWLMVLSNIEASTTDGAAFAGAASSSGHATQDDWAPSIPDFLRDELPALDADTIAAPGASREPPPEGQTPKAGVVRPADLPKGALDGPRGLFDPESGLGWEAYLRERLSAELRRSASFEQDLSLLIASLDGAKRGEEAFNLFAASIRDFFSFKDMAFLLGESGAAFILPNMDVDHALRMSEELLKKLSHIFENRAAEETPTVFMGLTSRAGRLVDADRLIGEAMAALGKARTDGAAPIMAFRPDPEKFRAYLAGQ